MVSAGASAPAFGVAPIAGGGTNNGSLVVTQGYVYYGDGSKLVGLAPGTNGQFLKTQGAAANPVWATVASGTGFGGDGSAGAITQGAATETTIKQINATAYSQTASTTYTILAGSTVNCTSTFTVNGTMAVS